MSPKQKFQSDVDLVRGYNEIIDSPKMQAAFDAAMLQFHSYFNVNPNGTIPDATTASAYAYMSLGARQFLGILTSLNTNKTEEKKPDSKSLNYKV